MTTTPKIALTLVLVSGLFVGQGFVRAQGSRTAEAQLKAAENKEQVEGDLKGAIDAYKKLAQSSDHAIAAKALLRMAGCYQQLGDAQATKIYQELVNKYGNQPEAAEAQRQLAVIASMTTRTAGLSTRVAWKPTNPDADPYRVSPDGRYVVYVDYNENDDLFAHDLVTGSDRRLTKGDKGDYAQGDAAFSRDGRRLAYAWFSKKDDRAELRTIDWQMPGVPTPTVVFSDKAVVSLEPYDWTPDGKSIAVELDRNDYTTDVGMVSVQDGVLKVVKRTGRWSVGSVCLSPDGSRLAFDLRAPNTRARDIYAVPTAGGVEIPVVLHKADDELVGWPSDGTLLFASDRTGTNGLYALPMRDGRSAGDPELIKPDVGRVSALGLTPSGSLYTAVDLTGSRADIKIGSFDFGTGDVLSAPTDLIKEYSVGSNSHPAWSPDGKSLAYESVRGVMHARSGEFSIMIRSAETNLTRELRPKLDYINNILWTPDGASLLVSGGDFTGHSGLWLIDISNGDVSPLGLDEAGSNLAFKGWSPDGRKAYLIRIHFADRSGVDLLERDLASGAMRPLFNGPRNGILRFDWSLSPDATKLYYRTVIAGSPPPPFEDVAFIAQDLASGAERQLIHRNLGNVNLSPDGRFIATGSNDVSTKSRSILLIPVAGGEPRELLRVDLPQAVIGGSGPRQTVLGVFQWAPDSRSLLLQKGVGPEKPPELWWVPTDGRSAPKLVKFVDNATDVRVSPDGRRMAFETHITAPPQASEVWVLENFLPRVTGGKK